MLRLNKQILYLPGNPKLRKKKRGWNECLWFTVPSSKSMSGRQWEIWVGGEGLFHVVKRIEEDLLIFEMHWTLWKDKLWFKSVWPCALMIISAWLLLRHKCFFGGASLSFVDSVNVWEPYVCLFECTHPHPKLYSSAFSSGNSTWKELCTVSSAVSKTMTLSSTRIDQVSFKRCRQ